MINKEDENYIYYLVSVNLKKQRKLHKLTQEQFAELCNYSSGFIMNIESEKYYQTFSLGTVYKFARVLKIEITKLFKTIDEENKNN